jgi:hypothetical protein
MLISLRPPSLRRPTRSKSRRERSAALPTNTTLRQERGEVAKLGANQSSGLHTRNTRPATAKEVGLSHREIHEARAIRDAEKRDPGIIRRIVDAVVFASRYRPAFIAIASSIASFLAWRKSRYLIGSSCDPRRGFGDDCALFSRGAA